jgi:hypothetical protein
MAAEAAAGSSRGGTRAHSVPINCCVHSWHAHLHFFVQGNMARCGRSRLAPLCIPRGLDSLETCTPQAFDELELDGRGHELLLILEAVAGADLDNSHTLGEMCRHLLPCRSAPWRSHTSMRCCCQRCQQHGCRTTLTSSKGCTAPSAKRCHASQAGQHTDNGCVDDWTPLAAELKNEPTCHLFTATSQHTRPLANGTSSTLRVRTESAKRVACAWLVRKTGW